MLRREIYLSIAVFMTAFIFAANIVTLAGFQIFDIAQGQVNRTSISSLTPEQKSAICDPNNPASKLRPVNTTESRICGIPVTVKPHVSSSNTTSSAAPSAVPTP